MLHKSVEAGAFLLRRALFVHHSLKYDVWRHFQLLLQLTVDDIMKISGKIVEPDIDPDFLETGSEQVSVQLIYLTYYQYQEGTVLLDQIVCPMNFLPKTNNKSLKELAWSLCVQKYSLKLAMMNDVPVRD